MEAGNAGAVLNNQQNVENLHANLNDISEAAKDAYVLNEASAIRKTIKRFPALCATLLLEMIVATIMSNYTSSFNKFPLLVCMFPVISAISGNVGLQASSANVRALALDIFKPKDFVKGMWPEFKASIAVSFSVGPIFFLIAFVWYRLGGGINQDGGDTHDSLVFAFAMWLGMCVAVVSAGITGSMAPLLFKFLKFGDPSALAGPLETAFQDIIGSSCLLTLSAAILQAWTITQDCPGGDLGGCVDICKQSDAINAIFVTVNQTCLNNCVDLAGQGIC